MMQRIGCFIIGVQKGGTTALAEYMGRHPSLQMSKRKELHYFDDESLDWSRPDHHKFHAGFDWDNPGVLRFEATPIYIYWPPSVKRLHSYNPAAKLILGLRHPTFRAHSHWRMETKRGAESRPFEAAISDAARQQVRNAPMGAHRVFSYVERGLYAPQLERLLSVFPREQLFVFRTDRLWSHRAATLSAIEAFLGLPFHPWEGSAAKDYVVPVDTSDLYEDVIPARACLDRLYRDDIQRTAALLDINLADWLEPGYCEPMKRAG